MTIEDFKTYVKTRKHLDTEEIHRFMDEMSNEARRVTFRLNAAYHTAMKFRNRCAFFHPSMRISVKTSPWAKTCLSTPAVIFKTTVES